MKESDLAALKSLQSEMYSVYALKDKCDSLNAKCGELKNSIENPPEFTFEGKPENSYESLKLTYSNVYKATKGNIKLIRAVITVITTLAIVAYTAFIVYDLFTQKISLLDFTGLSTILDNNIFRIILFAALQVIISVVLAILPGRITKGE